MTMQKFDLPAAQDIIGLGNVLTHAHHFTTFGRRFPEGIPVVCPSTEYIQKCADQNRTGEHNWILAWASALSFCELLAALAIKSQQQMPLSSIDWLYSRNDKHWIDSGPKAGYYLIDITPRWNGMGWNEQERRISEQGTVRADERVFSQAALTYYNANRQWSRGAESLNSHWGRITNSRGNRVCVKVDHLRLIISEADPSSNTLAGVFAYMALESNILACVT